MRKQKQSVFDLIIICVMLICGVVLCVLCRYYWHETHKQVCRMNLSQVGLALANFSASKECFPSGASDWSWIAESIPYIEGNAPRFPDRSKSWHDSANRHMRYIDKDTGEALLVEKDDWNVFLCPSASARTNPAGYGLTTYVGVGGVGRDAPTLSPDHPRAGLFGTREGTRVDQVKDGLATTMAVIETARENGPWRAPGLSTMRALDPSRKPYLGEGRQFGGLHREGAMVLFADGAVRFVGEGIDPTVFEAMATIAGREKVAANPPTETP